MLLMNHLLPINFFRVMPMTVPSSRLTLIQDMLFWPAFQISTQQILIRLQSLPLMSMETALKIRFMAIRLARISFSSMLI
ncbi:hypothetical protein KR49_00060 [Synechococcus sp. KORDI-49]|nr:hypothetical protein KR49_00060 [Synechococcus sp. KORDI-49]